MKYLAMLVILLMPIFLFSQSANMRVNYMNSVLHSNTKCFYVGLSAQCQSTPCDLELYNGYEHRSKTIYNLGEAFHVLTICFPRKSYTYTDRIDCFIPGIVDGCTVTVERR